MSKKHISSPNGRLKHQPYKCMFPFHHPSEADRKYDIAGWCVVRLYYNNWFRFLNGRQDDVLIAFY